MKKIPRILRFIFPYKEKKGVVYLDNILFLILFGNKISIILRNWLFQGMLFGGIIEVSGKTFIDFILSIIFTLLFDLKFYYSIILAHTANWILNTHFWVLFRYIIKINFNSRKRVNYINSLKRRMSSYYQRYIAYAFLMGSYSRNEVNLTSDVDIFIIPKRNLKSMILSYLFVIYERIISFFNLIPLDLYIFINKDKALEKYRKDENPIPLL